MNLKRVIDEINWFIYIRLKIQKSVENISSCIIFYTFLSILIYNYYLLKISVNILEE